MSAWWPLRRPPIVAPGDVESARLPTTARVVVVGVDGTPSGRAALRAAGEVAARAGLVLHGVHVGSDPLFLWAIAPTVTGCMAHWKVELELEAFLDTAQAAAIAGVDFEFSSESGDVCSALVRQARRAKAALVVVGADARHSGWHPCPARRLARRTDVPVLVAHR